MTFPFRPRSGPYNCSHLALWLAERSGKNIPMRPKSGYCVYAHSIGNVIFYVGKGTFLRPWCLSRRTKMWRDYVAGRKIQITVLAYFTNSDDAIRAETRLICLLKPTCNQVYFDHARGKFSNPVLVKFNVARVFTDQMRTRQREAIRRQREGNNWPGKPKKPVKCLNTGALYESISAAARANGCSLVGVSRVISGKRPHTKGLRFVLVVDRGAKSP